MLKGMDIDHKEIEREIIRKHQKYVIGLNNKSSNRTISGSTLPDSKPPLSSVKTKNYSSRTNIQLNNITQFENNEKSFDRDDKNKQSSQIFDILLRNQKQNERDQIKPISKNNYETLQHFYKFQRSEFERLGKFNLYDFSIRHHNRVIFKKAFFGLKNFTFKRSIIARKLVTLKIYRKVFKYLKTQSLKKIQDKQIQNKIDEIYKLFKCKIIFRALKNNVIKRQRLLTIGEKKYEQCFCIKYSDYCKCISCEQTKLLNQAIGPVNQNINAQFLRIQKKEYQKNRTYQTTKQMINKNLENTNKCLPFSELFHNSQKPHSLKRGSSNQIIGLNNLLHYPSHYKLFQQNNTNSMHDIRMEQTYDQKLVNLNATSQNKTADTDHESTFQSNQLIGMRGRIFTDKHSFDSRFTKYNFTNAMASKINTLVEKSEADQYQSSGVLSFQKAAARFPLNIPLYKKKL